MNIFHQTKDTLYEWSLIVKTKSPPRLGAILILSSIFLTFFLLGLGIGLGSAPSPPCTSPQCFTPIKYFITNHSHTCPTLSGENLAIEVRKEDSFEGLVVPLQCRSGFTPFPLLVKCQRKAEFDSHYVLEWSGLPVCYPSLIITKEHWGITPHAKSVSCHGTPQKTSCRLQCVFSYISVEESQYTCTHLPCRSWTLENRRCFRCDRNCTELSKHTDPSPGDMLSSLGCDSDCDNVVITSDGGAAVWQSRRTGLFSLVGEHNGRPLYQKNSTKEFLYFGTGGSQWLVGPDFTLSHGGLQFLYSKDNQCPDRLGGANLTKFFINYGQNPVDGVALWDDDDTLDIQCFRKGITPVEWCKCDHYDISVVGEGNWDNLNHIKYLSGRYSKVDPRDSYGLLAPLYLMPDKQLYLFSHHPEGQVWQVSSSLTTSPLRGISEKSSCPDSDSLEWEWYNSTLESGAQHFVFYDEQRFKISCVNE